MVTSLRESRHLSVEDVWLNDDWRKQHILLFQFNTIELFSASINNVIYESNPLKTVTYFPYSLFLTYTLKISNYELKFGEN